MKRAYQESLSLARMFNSKQHKSLENNKNKHMKAFIYILALILLSSCSAARVSDSWVNKDYTDYQPKKILIIGLTENLSGRTLFEDHLKTELNKRGINAVESYKVIKPTFTNLKQTEEDIEAEINTLSNDGYDAVLVSTVKGVDKKVSYSGDNFRTYYYPRRFGRYFYLAQDVYHTQGYYNRYKIYHLEASLYNLNEDNDKSLVWVASYDIVDPREISTTVSKYVTAIVKSLEQESVIPAINN